MTRRTTESAEHQRLSDRLKELAEHGHGVPCFGSSLPLSEDPDERALVREKFCLHCLAAPECRAAGKREVFGVWGGDDKSPPRGTYKPRTTTQEANQP